MGQEKLNIIYFADPLCSTCYGFSVELNKILHELNDMVDLRLVMGGLRPFNTETMEELSCFLEKEWKKVNLLSGQYFKYDILTDQSFIYDTEPSCRAVITMRKIAPKLAFPFFKAFQQSFYSENKNINNTEIIIDLANQFGVNKEQFKKEFESEALRQISLDEFSYTSKLGVKKFPTVAIQKEEQITILNEGYVKAEVLIQKIRQSLIADWGSASQKG